MESFQRLVTLTVPLFLLVLLGFAVTRWGRWPKAVADALTRFVFSVAIPALLFRMMSDFSRLALDPPGAEAFQRFRLDLSDLQSSMDSEPATPWRMEPRLLKANINA